MYFDIKIKKLIFLLSGDLPTGSTPYADLANMTGLTEGEVIATIKQFSENGLIRRFGATLRHQQAGFKANAMVVWQTPEAGTIEAGEKLAALDFVSHCYQRQPAPDWPYNLYAMTHAQNQDQLERRVEVMKSLLPNMPCQVLTSVKELKKTSLRYFAEGIDCAE